MEQPVHSFTLLFAQLGLPSDAASISQFISRHSPLDEHLELADAPFWSAAQATFLREAVDADADWAETVDALSAALRQMQPG